MASRKGSKNLMSADAKELLVKALRRVGDQKAKELGLTSKGIQAYFESMAQEDPKAFNALAGKLIPNSVESKVETGDVIVKLSSEDKKLL